MTEIFGRLFFVGVEPHQRLGFVEKHKQEIDKLYADRSMASSTWIDGRYIEYRPNVGNFDSVLDLPVRMLVDKTEPIMVE
ncbi:MAG: hypothetical protein GY832_26330 [Chloroflexi bacterium]|nr:hypothetical protein [Chloroflexota bacterium]